MQDLYIEGINPVTGFTRAHLHDTWRNSMGISRTVVALAPMAVWKATTRHRKCDQDPGEINKYESSAAFIWVLVSL